MTVRITHLTDPAASATSRRLAWVATAGDGRPLGVAFLRVPTAGGSAELDVQVHPSERRAGVGTRLLEAAGEAARSIRTVPVPEDSPAAHFCRARGMRQVLALTFTRLSLSEAPTEPGDPPAGYRMVHWDGRVPADLAETYARSRRAMDDMPMDDADYVPPVWDVDRLHAAAAAVESRGELLCTTAALAADGEIAGFTEVVIPAGHRGDAENYGTGVLPEHRGRGLALHLKRASIAHVRSRFPALAGLLADTADSNASMRHINETLGYRPTHRSLLYQLDLPPAS
ncbi:GNAT family N-acetyltransferase [Paractinoplanes rishiriensis]|uniref:N-acetyltransferase n=1 Tax=Paractinoplanes rishiriensis TaxID=1050105 RepID=A0A919K7X7_9ACTN|nr:GNAT family N-acetyltransferase [Actinoplanes rishiriensis]GIF00408.1 N-acetyltransferase [Actinoplanes rishiriensis]